MEKTLAWLTDHLRSWRNRRASDDWRRSAGQTELPLRAELFGSEQMEQRGRELAEAHQPIVAGCSDYLLRRLAENETALAGVCEELNEAAGAEAGIAPAGEWLLDNYYLIEEQIRTTRLHLPRRFGRELPCIADGMEYGAGASESRPRVYVLALEIVSHGDGRVDLETLTRFVAAYQGVTPLTLGELWATPIMLRLAVIENLRRVALRVAQARERQRLAGDWADRLIETAESSPMDLIIVVADMARSQPPMAGAFVAELSRRLQGRGPALALPLTWIEQRLAEEGRTIEQRVLQENQQQAADQVSIANSIGSLRMLDATDWREFVENLSVVEQALRGDPCGIYARMDFASRDQYRHAVERIARRCGRPEIDVARQAVDLATAATLAGASGVAGRRARHVGHYLIGRGLPELEAPLGCRVAGWEAVRRLAGRAPLTLYLGSIALFSLLVAAGFTAGARAAGLAPALQALAAALSLLAGSQFAVALVNWAVTSLVTPRRLPRMDYADGLPPHARTLVVVPTLLSSEAGVEALAEALEVRYLGNRDARLHFGLLTDFTDAGEETLPGDDALVDLARRRIEALNEKYRVGGDQNWDDIFFLFHRPRRWNPVEGVWMGYERKRGKLAALNALLRRGDRDPDAPDDLPLADDFSVVVGDIAVLSNVRYVITLDTDTQLPRDAARQFVGAMAHPLNRPLYDEASGRVVDGYGILQPRVASNLPGSMHSPFARLYGGEPGIDPYTRGVSEVYQDLFDEGSFIGKGIYDVDAFEAALGGRLPENRILSHDLIEGCYARSGLLGDVELYEAYPASYLDDVARRHRWIRGDWQIAGWLWPRVPPGPASSAQDAPRPKNPLSVLSRWKIADNLRRSLVPAATLALLPFGWLLLPQAGGWTLAVLALPFLPALCAFLRDVLRPTESPASASRFAAAAGHLGRRGAQMAFELASLPHETYWTLDAVVRVAWRMAISRRLLEWKPAADAVSMHGPAGGTRLPAFAAAMWTAPAAALGIGVALAFVAPAALLPAAPVLLLWLGSPLLAWRSSRPDEPRLAGLDHEQLVFLRLLSRRVWSFFDTFVGPQENWLPPDNFQLYRMAMVAHRTSPTNIGMALLANLAAYDFGFIPAGQVIARSAATLATMGRLERYRGHFYNWYDTVTLQPLLPLYVSSVDSGNLAGHLLTLRSGLLALPDDPVFDPRQFEGLRVALDVFLADAADLGDEAAAEQVVALRVVIVSACASPPPTLAGAVQILATLADSAGELVACVERAGAGAGADDGDGPEEDGIDPDTGETTRARPAVDEKKRLQALAAAQSLQRQCRHLLDDLSELAAAGDGEHGFPTLRELAAAGDAAAQARIDAIAGLAARCAEFADIDYDFLYDRSRHLLTIGYNVGEHRADASYYDLLASEARLATFVAIAQGKLPQESWFALGRLISGTGAHAVLMSWTGSMFEYLMPLLVMPNYPDTLLDSTYTAAVARQIDYGERRGVPWGISESGYNSVDVHFNYQYRAFGVPGLGLKRGLGEDLVVAPYASVMALMVSPREACANLERLDAAGLLGSYGFYEAIDYTPARQRRGQTHAAVLSFMAHHQGMSLLALAYLLLDRPMQARFEADLQFRAILPLLQERIPHVSAPYRQTTRLAEAHLSQSGAEKSLRVFDTPDTPAPEVQLLSNGRYHVMVTNAGGGYSRWKDFAVTRWREDGTRDDWGTFCYVRELPDDPLRAGAFWSTAYQPTLRRPESYEAIFSEGRAEFRRRDAAGTRGEDGRRKAGRDHFETHTEVVVSPEDDIELRRVRISNRSRARRTVEITTYAEVVLAPPAADAAHPAFSKLFVQTELVPERHAILCTRRPRSPEERPPWLLHMATLHGAESADVSYETDRLRFIGRGRTAASPLALSGRTRLSGTAGPVLDPIVAVRHVVTLAPEQTVIIDIVTGAAETREQAAALADKYHDRHLADRVIDLAWTHSQVVLRQLDASEAEAMRHAQLAGPVIHADGGLRGDPAVLIRNRRGQSALWSYAISGDLPIVLLQIAEAANLDLVRQLVQAHAYWRLKGLAVDLVIWNEDRGGYRQNLQDDIMGLVASSIEAALIDKPGGIFVRQGDQISGEDRNLFQSVARVVLSDQRGPLDRQLDERRVGIPLPPPLEPTRRPRGAPMDVALRTPARILENGLGGFSPDGREYVIRLEPGKPTPAPWVNVLANPDFGAVVSESGGGYTWAENAHEFRLTPWHNDPVSDAAGEALYLRDEASGEFWSPTPLPAGGELPHLVRHGFGYSVFETSAHGIASELTVFVALDAPVKLFLLRVRNESGRPRRLSATGYVEWVLGDLRTKSAMHVSTEIDARTGALLARNPYSMEFGDRIAFFDTDDAERTVSGDRAEFIGRNGSLRQPAALARERLSERVGAALDPCAALQVAFELGVRQEREIVFRLGAGSNPEQAEILIRRFRGTPAAKAALNAVREHWSTTLGTVQVTTPLPSVDVLANGWLIYQTLACRLWARSGYYQSGGAFGFRDQLQDSMALIHAAPQLLRKQLLRSAAHQFTEGDVQHWWHPPAGRGVRTACSDDYLWLPLAVARYVEATGDAGVLDEPVHFIEGRPLGHGEESYYDLPGRSADTAPLYEHCVRAIRHAQRTGEHGLPLMGAGDWNDGMNLVGIEGKGESVWVGFFLCEVLRQFSGIARRRCDDAFAAACLAQREELARNIDRHAWDGAWYRRAWFDDGRPLGSAGNQECRIDSIAQSWSVIAGATDPERARQAMRSLDTHLVRRDARLIQLLDPPFDDGDMNPGYIRGYVPGVRENGGQYTHAALWATMAFAELGDADKAWELLGLINPVEHARNADEAALYKVEPYVVAADVYGQAPHTGRGGWSWYTGSAGWAYRLVVESLLGVRRAGTSLRIEPRLPASWPGFSLVYRFGTARYRITVSRSAAGASLAVDGVARDDGVIPLVDDGGEHEVSVTLPE